MKRIIGIMATTSEGVIGIRGKLPWNYSNELEYFRNITRGQIMVMGHKTYEATPAGLFKTRQAIVLSRSKNLQLANALVLNDLSQFIDYARILGEVNFFMIGGSEIAELFLQNNLISYFVLTTIHKLYPGDTYLKLSHFKRWGKKKLSSNADYTITLLANPKQITWNL